MKIGRVFPDLLAHLGAADSLEEGLARTLRRLTRLTGAVAAELVFRPERAEAIVVTAARGRSAAALAEWLGAVRRRTPARGLRVTRVPVPAARRRRLVLLRTPLGPPPRPVGELTLVGPLGRATLPAGFPRELGTAIERVWQIHQRTRRMAVLNQITRLGVSGAPLDEVFRAFTDGVASLVRFDSIGVSLIDAERAEFTVVDLPARSLGFGVQRDLTLPLGGTLLAEVAARRAPVRVDDLQALDVPPSSRQTFAARGYRSALLVPLVSHAGALGAVTLAARVAAAFDDRDLEIAAELAHPLAAAIEQRRLLDESRRRAEELAALYETSRLITTRLDLPSVLEAISRSVTAL
ncbi:MAG: GAF domain-containing protein, partial [Candidatus Rokubacteria bacterium]|nr:GAF domain-containing protein [Candidatus Rokubacteria bacterium]